MATLDKILLGNVVPQTGNQWQSNGTKDSGLRFIENVKGPTTAFTNIMRIYPVSTPRATIATALNISTDNVPDLSNGVWILESFSNTVLDSGDHSLAQFTWKHGLSSGQIQPTYNWGLEWQAYTMNLLAFCKNQLHNEHIFGKDQLSANETAYAPYIKSYLDSSNKNVLSSGEYLYKKQQQGAFFQLNKHESEIAKKMQGGVEFVEYHRPVVTKITTSPELSDGTDISQVTGFDNIGENIDIGPVTIEDLPFDIQPPTSDFGDWVYKKSLDSIQVKADPNTGISVWTRTEQWQGALSIDLNLYGSANIGMLSGRWMIGAM